MEKRAADPAIAPTFFLWSPFVPNRYYYEVCYNLAIQSHRPSDPAQYVPGWTMLLPEGTLLAFSRCDHPSCPMAICPSKHHSIVAGMQL